MALPDRLRRLGAVRGRDAAGAGGGGATRRRARLRLSRGLDRLLEPRARLRRRGRGRRRRAPPGPRPAARLRGRGAAGALRPLVPRLGAGRREPPHRPPRARLPALPGRRAARLGRRAAGAGDDRRRSGGALRLGLGSAGRRGRPPRPRRRPQARRPLRRLAVAGGDGGLLAPRRLQHDPGTRGLLQPLPLRRGALRPPRRLRPARGPAAAALGARPRRRRHRRDRRLQPAAAARRPGLLQVADGPHPLRPGGDRDRRAHGRTVLPAAAGNLRHALPQRNRSRQLPAGGRRIRLTRLLAGGIGARPGGGPGAGGRGARQRAAW